MKGLTERQHKLLTFIRRAIATDGYPPTLREMGKHMDIKSTNGVHDHLNALERKGYLRRTPGRARALRVTTLERF